MNFPRQSPPKRFQYADSSEKRMKMVADTMVRPNGTIDTAAITKPRRFITQMLIGFSRILMAPTGERMADSESS